MVSLWNYDGIFMKDVVVVVVVVIVIVAVVLGARLDSFLTLDVPCHLRLLDRHTKGSHFDGTFRQTQQRQVAYPDVFGDHQGSKFQY